MTEIDDAIYKQITANEVLIQKIRLLQADLAAANTDCVRMRESKNRVETELDHTEATLTAMRLANASDFKRGQEAMKKAVEKELTNSPIGCGYNSCGNKISSYNLERIRSISLISLDDNP